jgi:hypothetical protein
MIDHEIPEDWKGLQNGVALILQETGFEVEIEKTIQTVRGTVEIDVFAIDKTQSPEIVYLCECKYWNSPIPQTVAHAFRVMSDYGANVGLIISKVGFQTGTNITTENTNVKLIDWFEFQELFKERWLRNFVEYLYEIAVPLVDYSEPVNGSMERIAQRLSSEGYSRFQVLKTKYFTFASLGVMLKFLPKSRDIPRDLMTFPVDPKIFGMGGKPIHSYRELGAYYSKHVSEALAKFDDLFEDKVRLPFRRSKIHELFATYPEITRRRDKTSG